jgi:KTSC domain-containing protein
VNIEMQTVQSSNLKAIGYDSASETLAVEFANGVYHYAGIAPELFADFQAAESKGKFFQQHIRPRFAGVKQASLAAELNNIVDHVCAVVDGAQ